MKEIVFDLRGSFLLGPTCKIFEIIGSVDQSKYKVTVINNDWTFGGKSNLLWDPSTHPKDIFYNLLVPTLGVTLVEPRKYNKSFLKIFLPYFNRLYFCNYDIINYFASPNERLNYRRFLKSSITSSVTLSGKIKSICAYISFLCYMKFSAVNKIRLQSKTFRLCLGNKDSAPVVNFLDTNRMYKRKCILLSVTWDPGMVFENKSDRTEGGPVPNPDDFKHLKNTVRMIDSKILDGSLDARFILASKKAVSWGEFIRSDFIDLRNFEDLGLSISEMIYCCQEMSFVTFNWPSTFSTWITNSSDIIHYTWGGEKDSNVSSYRNAASFSPSEILKFIKSL